jgi:hypothetical protein
MTSGPENFRPGDCVRKWVSERAVTPFIGIVTHIVPSTYKVWVQWPIEHSQESPETLVKVNPAIFGMPTVNKDTGYDSYEKSISEKLYGRIPKRVLAHEKMALRIAHTFAINVVGKLVDDIVALHDEGLAEVPAYNRIYEKYADICSDHIMKLATQKVYCACEA